MSETLSVVVGSLAVSPDGTVLLIKSPKWSHKWVIPGGHIEYGETAEQAVVREFREETGLHVTDVRALGWQERIFDPTFWKKKHFVMLDFWCRTVEKKVTLNDEATECRWVSVDEALTMDLGQGARLLIERYRDQS